jgi:hypothetical protein
MRKQADISEQNRLARPAGKPGSDARNLPQKVKQSRSRSRERKGSETCPFQTINREGRLAPILPPEPMDQSTKILMKSLLARGGRIPELCKVTGKRILAGTHPCHFVDVGVTTPTSKKWQRLQNDWVQLKIHPKPP